MGVPSLQRRRPYKERKGQSAREEAAGRGQSDAATSPAGQGLAEAGRRLPRARAGGPASTLTSDLQPAALGESKLLLQQAMQLAGLVGSQRRGPAPVGVSGPPASWGPSPRLLGCPWVRLQRVIGAQLHRAECEAVSPCVWESLRQGDKP